MIIDIFPWKIYYEGNITQKAYKKIDKGYAEKCGCEHCLNFIKVRNSVYPEQVKRIFQELGIDYRKEAEIFYLNKIRPGLHHYRGWFHFVGNVECIDETQLDEDKRLTHYVDVDENFSWSFSRDDVTPHEEAFNGLQLCLLYFSINIPWMTDAEEPE